MTLFRKALVSLCILFIICLSIVFNSKADTNEGFKKDHIAGVNYICFTKEAIMKLSSYDVNNKIESITTARALVALGKCQYFSNGILIKVKKVIHEYTDYNNFKVQVFSCVNPAATENNSVVIYTAAYKQLAKNLPLYNKDIIINTPEELKV